MPTPLRLLILEGSTRDAELEIALLEESGYECQWKRVETRDKFLACFGAYPPEYDVILADYSLPGFDAISALKLLLERDLDLPFIIVSSTFGEETAVECLKSGADDYVIKNRLSRLGPAVKRALLEREEQRQRKQAEKALRESEEQHRMLVENMDISFHLWDREGNVLFMNDSAARYLGGEPKSFVGKSLYDIIPDTAEGLIERIHDIIESGEGREFEDVVELSSGRRWFWSRLQPVAGAGDGIPSVQCISNDITRRKQAEMALKESEEKYRRLFDNTIMPITVWDTDLRLLFCNSVAARNLGGSYQSFVGKTMQEIIPGIGQTILDRINSIVTTGIGEQFEDKITLPTGLERWFWSDIQPLKNADGDLFAIQLISEDTTKRKHTEEALRESEERYRVVAEKTGQMVYDYDLATGAISWLGAIKEITGYGLEEFQLVDVDTWGTMIHPKDRESALELLDESRKKCGRYDTEYRFRRKDGSYVHIEEHGIFLPDEDGHSYRMLGTMSDITDRRQAEEALKDSETRLKGIFMKSPIGIEIFDSEGKNLIINDACREIFGVTDPSAMKGLELFSSPFIPDDEKEKLKRGESVRFEVPYDLNTVRQLDRFSTTKSGSIYLDVLASPVFREDEDVASDYLIHVQDITERNRAEEALRESEEKHRVHFENASDVIYSIGPDSRILSMSPSVEKVLGYRPEELIGRPFPELNLLAPECQETARATMMGIFAGKEVSPSEYDFIARDGTRIHGEVSSAPLIEKGKVVSIIAVARDITERKRAEEEKARIEEQYHHAQKVESIGRLAGGVAHDLNNMLSPVLGYSEMLLDDLGSGDARREFADEILRAGFRARDLVRQLLAFSRKQTLEYRPVDMNKAVTDFEKLLRRTIREDIEIKIVPSPDIRMVMADIGQIEQVIMNLAVNAADAMPEGGHLTIETAPVNLDEEYAAKQHHVQPGRYVMLAVSDIGCGMDDETREHLFEPFFSTKGEQGTGLGLATVYGIVKQHGGNIWVYSEPGKGATFKVYLPVTDKEARAEEKTGRKPAAELKGSETILLVEDNDQMRHLAHAILKRQGYTVLEAESGPHALTLLASYDAPVHLLLTDVVMPKMNGRELFNRVAEEYPNLKVLFMSGYTDSVIAHHGVLDEGITFIQKPFAVQALAAKVRELLGEESE